MTQRDDLLGRVKELRTATEAHRATARVIRAMIFDGDYAGASTALDDLEADLHPAIGAGGPGGSGLPEQWTDGGNGNVTAEADAGNTPLTVIAPDDTVPALALYPSQDASIEAIAIVRFHGHNGDTIGDLDAEGNLVMTIANGDGYSFGGDGSAFFIVDQTTKVASSPQAMFQDKAGRTTLRVNHSASTPGFAAVMILSTKDEQPALWLQPFDENNDALSVFGGPDYNGDEYRVWGDGKFSTKAHTAPADGDITAGECVFWFDQTDGAAKPMVKGKSADGTIFTGELTGLPEPITEAVTIAPDDTSFADEPDGLGAALRINLPTGFYDATNGALSIVDENGVQVLKLRATNNAAGVQIQSATDLDALAFIDLSAEDNSVGDTYIGTDIGIHVADNNLTMSALMALSTDAGGGLIRELFNVDPDGAGDGYFKIGNNAVPPDAYLAPGECAIYFDKTNGAAKLMLKGKTANGTVVTGQIALS